MLENKWALVVEADAHTLLVVSGILRDLGIHFKRNTTGTDVPEQIRNMSPPPDFILLDIDLPNGDAFTINYTIRADAAANRIPVIALGSPQDSARRSQIERSGFAGFIAKPLPRRQFGEFVGRVLAGERIWETAV